MLRQVHLVILQYGDVRFVIRAYASETNAKRHVNKIRKIAKEYLHMRVRITIESHPVMYGPPA